MQFILEYDKFNVSSMGHGICSDAIAISTSQESIPEAINLLETEIDTLNNDGTIKTRRVYAPYCSSSIKIERAYGQPIVLQYRSGDILFRNAEYERLLEQIRNQVPKGVLNSNKQSAEAYFNEVLDRAIKAV